MTTPNFQFPSPNFQHNYQAPYLGVGSWWLGVATLSRSPFIRRRVRLCCTWTGQQAREKSASSSCLAGRHTRLHQRRSCLPGTPSRCDRRTGRPRPFRVRTTACPALCCRRTGSLGCVRRSRRPRTYGGTRDRRTRRSACTYSRGSMPVRRHRAPRGVRLACHDRKPKSESLAPAFRPAGYAE